MKRLGEIGEGYIGLTYAPDDVSDTGTIVLRSGNIQDSKLEFSDVVRVNKKISEKLKVKNGDILICSRNGSPKLVGKSALITGLDEEMTFGAFMMIFKSNYNQFLIHYLHSPYFKRQLSKSATTTINQITKKMLDEIEVPFPPLEIQKQIAKTLDTAAELLGMRKQQLAELDNLIKSTFYDMFGDPVTNEKGWKITLIEGAIAKENNAIKAGPFGSALKKEFYVEKGYKIYGQEQVINNDATYGDYYVSEAKYKELENCAVQADDVLISLVGTYGKLLIIPEKFQKGIINPRLMKITFDKTKVNTTYFKYYFISESLKNVLSRMSRGGTMDILNVGIVRKLEMPLPPLDIQIKFAKIVAKIEEQKSLANKAIAETQLLFDSLMAEYFE